MEKKISIKTEEDGFIKSSDIQNFEDFLISMEIGQKGVNIHPFMSRDLYGFGMDLYELPTLIIYPFEPDETTSGKANGVQMIFDLGKDVKKLIDQLLWIVFIKRLQKPFFSIVKHKSYVLF